MSLLSCGGVDVLRAVIDLPLSGAWLADCDLIDDGGKVPAGRVAISAPSLGLSLSGTIVAGSRFHGRTKVTVLGGAGGLSRILPARFYRAIATRALLNDTLSAGGEKVSATSDTGILGRTIASWSRPFSAVSATLDAVVARTKGATWRTLRSGDVWIGVSTYGATNQVVEYRDEDPGLNTFDFATDTLTLDPGVTLDGRKLTRVRYTLSGDGIRGSAWWL